MVGQFTWISRSWGKEEGWGANVNPFKKNMSMNEFAADLLTPAELMSIPRKKHLILYQQHMNKPIYADTPFYFENDKLKDLVDPKHGGKIEAAPPMPQWMVDARINEEKAKLEVLELVGPRKGGTKFGRNKPNQSSAPI